MNYGVQLRVAPDSGERALYSLEKLPTEPRTLLLVPKKRVLDIRRCCRADKDLHYVRRLLRRR